MDRIFKPPVSVTGAISQDRESCQFPSWLMKTPLLYQAARPESGRDARERSLGWLKTCFALAGGLPEIDIFLPR